MANFSPGAMFKIGRENLQESVLHYFFVHKVKFECDYMRFFSPFDRAEIFSLG